MDNKTEQQVENLAEEKSFTEDENEKLQIEDLKDQIHKLSQQKRSNDFDIGKILAIAQKNTTDEEFKQFLQDKKVNIKPTQAKKIITAYKYVKKKEPSQSADFYKIGIEKVYIIATLEEKELQNDFEKLTKSEKPSVKILKKMKTLLNKNYKKLKEEDITDDEKLNINQAFEQAKKDRELGNEDTVTNNKYKELEEKYNKLLAENVKLKDELEILKNKGTEEV